MKSLLRQFLGVAISVSFMSTHPVFSQKNTVVSPMKEQADKQIISSSGSWSTLDTGVNGVVRAIAASGSNVYVGGDFTTAGGVPSSHIAKWNGSSWSALGIGTNGSVRSIAISGSDLYAGGNFTTAGGVSANYIAKWNSSSWSALGSGTNGTVRAITISGSDVYAGGQFTTAGGDTAKYIAKWDGNSWSAMGSGDWDGDIDEAQDYYPPRVYAVAVYGSDVYIGGLFSMVNGISIKDIAKWDGTSWAPVGSGLGTWYDSLPYVLSLLTSGSNIYAGGKFFIPAYPQSECIAKWNGSSWSALGSGVSYYSMTEVYTIETNGNYIYAGGRFNEAGGTPANNIAKWNGSNWSALDQGVNDIILASAVSGSDVYVGGYFTTAGGVSANYIAVWHEPTIPTTPQFTGFTQITAGAFGTDTGASHGCAWGDYNSDGYLDLFVANDGGANNFLYLNNGDTTFTKITTGPVVTDGGYSFAGTWGDYDNDGHPDLFVANAFGENNFLYKNNGDATFTKITSGNIVTDGGNSWGCSWTDYNSDGHLDLFVANKAENNFLYQNNGNGTFTRITTGDLVSDGASSVTGAWADYDNDGDPDLFVANDLGENNCLYTNNDNGTFTQVTTGDIVTDGGESWSASWGDYNNDTYLDLFVGNNGDANFLYTNNGDGTFTKVTAGDIVTDVNHTRSSAWGDCNNDGNPDLFVSNRNSVEYSYMFINNGNGTFTKYTTGMVNSRGCSWGDFNRDGFLDLFAGVDTDINLLYLYSGTKTNHWLNIRCVGMVSNASGIGARVKVKATINGTPLWQTRELFGQTGFGGQNSLNAEFGLGNAVIVDSIRIEWPSGTVWDTTDVAVNQFLTIMEKVAINHPPVAADDSVTITQDSTVCIAVLSNDSDMDGDALSIQSVDTTGTSGTVVIDPGDTTVTYTPDLGFTGEDAFLYILSDGKGGLDTALVTVEVIEDTKVERIATRPTEFRLSQNVPNPFNPTTTIPYTLAKAARVKLTVYSLKGDEILVLIDTHQPAGDYRVEWNGRNASGQQVPSGIYFYRIETDTYVQTRKMLFIR